MPAARDEPARRSVVPQAAGRSLWLTAVWTGVGTAVVCALASIIAVAICWLPTAASSGHSMSAIRAGLLTFLASVHGGVTVDGTPAAFLPLGLTIIVGLVVWRAGGALADIALALDEQEPARLAGAVLAQAATFMCACLVLVPFATLGTSSAPSLGVAVAAFLLFVVVGGTSLARSTPPLRDWLAQRVPPAVRAAARPAAMVVLLYLAAGALLVAGSLVVHRGQAEALSTQVGGGWSGVPVLLLGILAAPNAAIAGTAYLAGPGFAVGAGTTASVFSAAHGTLPAFPVLAAVPDGSGSPIAGWVLSAATVLGSGLVLARTASSAQPGLFARMRWCAAAAPLAGAVLFVLAWQGGGGIGTGALRTVGVSPWQLGAAVTAELAVVSVAALAVSATWQRSVRRRPSAPAAWERVRDQFVLVAEAVRNDRSAGTTAADHDAEDAGKLAG
jgi:hypothetical protein